MIRFLALSLLLGCANTASLRPVPTANAPRAIPPEKAKVEYEKLGRAVPIGKSVEVIGAESVWVEGHPLLITLEQTLWDTVGDTRTGRAKLRFMHDGESMALTIAEGQTKTAYGYTITVEVAHESYDKVRYSYVPVCKLVVKK